MNIYLPGPGQTSHVYLSKSDSIDVAIIAPTLSTGDSEDLGVVNIYIDGLLGLMLNDPQVVRIDRGCFLLSAKMASEIQSAIVTAARELADLKTRLDATGIS